MMSRRFGRILAGWMAAVLVVGFVTAGCGRSGEKTFGKEISVEEKTSIGEILKEPAKFHGQVVRVEGTVDEVCQSMGCWFYLKDETGRMMIDLEMRPDSFDVPKNSSGKLAVVEGKVKYDGSAPVRIVGIGTTLQ